MLVLVILEEYNLTEITEFNKISFSKIENWRLSLYSLVN